VHDVHGDVVLENRLIRNSIADLAGSLRIVESMLMEAVAYRRSQYFMACSGPLRQHLACRGFDPEKIVVIRNGVDTRLFKPCCCSTNNENFMVTYAGSFQKWQGIDNLLEAAELLPESNIKFKIVGFKDPILKSKIKKRLKGNGILIDDVPQFELVKHLCESDILVIPRSWNPAAALAFPTKFAEYCAVGKPVIVTQVDETSHFVEHYDCGFVCEPTPESIARTITEAYNSSHTVLLRKGRNARVLAVEEFDRLVIGRQLLEFLSGTVQVA
jgi:glycosyltransferase involved in cell wall biosynthesis